VQEVSFGGQQRNNLGNTLFEYEDTSSVSRQHERTGGNGYGPLGARAVSEEITEKNNSRKNTIG